MALFACACRQQFDVRFPESERSDTVATFTAHRPQSKGSGIRSRQVRVQAADFLRGAHGRRGISQAKNK